MRCFIQSLGLSWAVIPTSSVHQANTCDSAVSVATLRTRCHPTRRHRSALVLSAKSSSSPTPSSAPLEPPPATFFQAIKQAQTSVLAALKDGYKLLEVEFPPLPADKLESASTSAYDVSDANLRLALDFGKRFVDDGYGTVVLALPDLIEKDRIVEMCGESDRIANGMRVGAIKDADNVNLIERLWMKSDPVSAVREEDGMFIVLGASAQELPDVEKLVELAGDRPVILFNLKLDVSRGDLGLPAFPSKALHFRFLSRVFPAYYLRTRSYSRNVPRPPYLVNFSGALYKAYPGKWQVLLDGAGEGYTRVATLDERPPLGKVRDLLTENVEIDGIKIVDAAAPPAPLMNLLRKGYKSTTWWEEDYAKQVSNNWRL